MVYLSNTTTGTMRGGSDKLPNKRIFARIPKVNEVVMADMNCSHCSLQGHAGFGSGDSQLAAADVIRLMGAQGSLVKLKDMVFGLVDTISYSFPDDIKKGFMETSPCSHVSCS